MELVKASALAAAPKAESFMLLDVFFFLNTNERSQIEFSQWCHEPESSFFSVPLTRRADFRQCLPTYLTEWQWLSALLFSSHSHFPVCWWIPTPRHCVGGMPETALHSAVLMLQLGWGTLLMLLMKLCCSIELFYAQLMPFYIHHQTFCLIKRQLNIFCVDKCTYEATARPS